MHIQRSWLSTMTCYDLPSCCMLLSFPPAGGYQGLDQWSCCHQWSITGAGWCHTWSSSITCCDGPSRVRRATGSVSESIARCDPIKETTLRKGGPVRNSQKLLRHDITMTSRWSHTGTLAFRIHMTYGFDIIEFTKCQSSSPTPWPSKPWRKI